MSYSRDNPSPNYRRIVVLYRELHTMFSYANRFVFACVACFPALATLPNGENAHCTVRPFSWWREIFAAAGNDHPQILWELFEAQREHHEHGSS